MKNVDIAEMKRKSDIALRIALAVMLVSMIIDKYIIGFPHWMRITFGVLGIAVIIVDIAVRIISYKLYKKQLDK